MEETATQLPRALGRNRGLLSSGLRIRRFFLGSRRNVDRLDRVGLCR
jgi:hypothetical protein